MTRIFTDGAEMQDTLFWTGSTNTSVQSSTPAISPYYYYGTEGQPYKSFSGISEFYFRMRYRDNQITYGGRHMPSFRNGGTEIAWLAPNGAYIAAYTSAGLLATASTIINSNQWYLYQIYFKLADSGGRFVWYVDGNLMIDYTGDTKPTSTTTIDNIYMAGNGSGNQYWDDLALNDTNNTDGKNDNSWCGDGIVIRMTPSGSSATANDWLNSGSVSGSANYLYVDDFPANSTDYVYASASSTGLQTQFALSNPSIPVGASIKRIYAEARARKISAGDYGVKLGELAEGGTDVVSGSRTLYTSSFLQILGNESKINPVSGSAWTTTDLNNLELVLEI